MIDLEALTREIQCLTPRKRLFKLLKTELTVLGYWRNKPRGNPHKAYEKVKSRFKPYQQTQG